MTAQLVSNALTFVWQSEHVLNSLDLLSRKTHTGIIVDLTADTDTDNFIANHNIQDFGIRLSWHQYSLDSSQSLLKKHPPKSIWIEIFPDILSVDIDNVLNQLIAETAYPINLITGDLHLIHKIFENKISGINLVLKGNEAGGYTGAETTLTLFSYTESLAGKFSFYPRISIWGGVCTPEAAATFLVSGAETIIFEQLHVLTDDYTHCFSKTLAERLQNCQLEHTRLVPISSKTLFRFYDKGNSLAVKELSSFTSSVQNQKDPKGLIAKRIDSSTVPLHRSNLDRKELIGAGVETAFAPYFCSRFGTASIQAIERFSAETAEYIDNIQNKPFQPHTSYLTKEFGGKYPIIQGAMACITDRSGFARQVSDAGALPTLALGIKSLNTLSSELSDLKETMGTGRYAVNIITLDENPYRDEQLEWIKTIKPPFVVISAGSPFFAKELQNEGQDVIYVTSDPNLMQLAWENGIRYVVCEGNEAGGHIGSHSTLTLAQSALKSRWSNKSLASLPIILAGGIYNESSAKRAFHLGAEGIQVGTAYLATREIVALEALNKLYQELVIASTFGDTLITGRTVGLQVRSLSSPKSKQINSLEKEYHQLGKSEDHVRKQLEKLSIGSLTVAAKATMPGGLEKLSEDHCRQEGQYMCGAVCGGLDSVTSVKDLHEKLTAQDSSMILRNDRSLVRYREAVSKKKERIAITGMAISNSLGNSPDQVWKSSYELKSGITEIPPERWDHGKYYSEKLNTPGKTYCKVGAFSSLEITRKELGISPHDFRTMTHSTKLTLWLAHKAISDSGILGSDHDHSRIGVIIAQNSGESAHTIGDLTITVKADEIVDSIKNVIPLDSVTANALVKEISKNRISTDDTTLLGRLSCTAGGFICNKYNFQGISFAVTAACATGLVALYNAVQLIRNNILDVAIVGGGEELLHPASYLEFSALGALGGKNQSLSAGETSRPFDTQRDGMILGEGGAMLVLEREHLATARHANIYSYITGVGASNNDLGMIESVAKTQQLAINSSFADANYPPSEVDLVECHATATPTGDIEEIKALKAVYPKDNNTVLSSFKSQIGHTLGTSGLNSLIRGICAMNQKVFPPTINYDTVDSEIDLESWGFEVCQKPQRWKYSQTRPRRFQVNAFGFGGANYVVQLEQADWSAEVDDSLESLPDSTARQTESKLSFPGVAAYSATYLNTSYRIGVSDNRDQESLTRLISEFLAVQTPSPADLRKLHSQEIFIEKENTSSPLALIFAGQGTHYKQMGKELYETYPTIHKWMDIVAGLADFDILEIMFRDEDTDLRKTVWQQPALFVLEYSIYKQLEEFGLQPSVLAGHSMGELTALAVAGVFGFEDAFRIISKRATCMDKASKMVDDPGAMLAVDVPEDILASFVNNNSELYYTNYNSPHQTVIGGSTEAIEQLANDLETEKFWNHILPVSMAFHSPLMRVIRDELGDYLADIDFQPPQIPVISNTTCQPYPDNVAQIQKIIISHLESPVHWQNNMKTLHDQFAVKCYLEIGPRDTLCRLLNDIIPDAESLFSCYPELEAKTIRKAVARLHSLGHLTASNQSKSLVVHEPQVPHERDENKIYEIIQNEINIYALQGIEKYLKPAILKSIQDNIDPHFTGSELSDYFGSSAQMNHPLPPPQAASILPPAAAIDAAAQEEPRENLTTLEVLISIIMDATGYERSELAPEMDIRQDLSIRSSRLPVIMDAVEKAFGISIKLEEFMGIKTIGDFAAQIDKTMKEQGVDRAGVASNAEKEDDKVDRFSPRLPVKRFISRRRELSPASSTLLKIPVDAKILILTTDDNDTVNEAREYFTQQLSAHTTTVVLAGPSGKGLDPCDHIAVQKCIDLLPEQGEFSGIILITGEEEPSTQPAPSQISSYVAGLFLFLRNFLQSDRRLFCIHLRLTEEETLSNHLLSEGLLGLFLTAQIEYQSVLFRSLLCRDLPDFQEITGICFDSRQKTMELELVNGTIFAEEFIHCNLSEPRHQNVKITNNDVILLTAGAKGVTARLARSLNRSGATLILLGRSPYHELSVNSRDEVELIAEKEIHDLLTELRANGSTTEYRTCDISDPEQVAHTVEDILAKYSKIDILVHGAGILADGFISLLQAEDFVGVTDVKLTGLVQLVDAIGEKNLRQIIGLSSIAALSGNIGQANYCCANRAMAAYLKFLHHNSQISSKVFWLPPIEGTGMADDPEVKDLVKLKIGKQAYVDANEISEIMMREIHLAPASDCSVAPIRQLPKLETVLMEDVNSIETDGWFDCSGLPLIDQIVVTDFESRRIVAERVLTQEHDLWICDHRPFKWLQHPIISAIMVVETFFEAARLHNPLAQAHTVKNISFERILECPQETGVRMIIDSQEIDNNEGGQTCRVTLRKHSNQTPAGDNNSSGYFSGDIETSSEILECDKRFNGDLPQADKEFMTRDDILHYYEQRTGLTHRYRVLEKIIELTETTIAGVMDYPEINDFATDISNKLLYPHYILEALMQIGGFHSGINNPKEERVMVPTAIEQLNVTGNSKQGEKIFLLGTRLEDNPASSVWDCFAVKENGDLLLSISGLTMKWLS